MVSGLAVRDAVVRYGTTVAVDGVSLDVSPGEVVALLGASGSGKSSLLRAVAGLEPLVGGTLRWDGVDLGSVPVHKRGFGLMFQEGQLFPHLSVAGNVAYGLFRQPRAERARRVEELLELVGLPGYGPRSVASLSGGQAQRVALARSLAPAPKLLLLDEPLSALDRALRERLVDVLRTGLKTTHTTAIYVTHDQDEAFNVADRIAVLENGRLLQIGRQDELWRRPVSRAVAEFLGYGPFLVAQRNGGGVVTALGVIPADDLPDAEVLVGIGPTGLVLEAGGAAVDVLDQHVRRGHVEISVRLPDGQRAEVRSEERAQDDRVHVALDPDGCALVPADA